VVVIEGTHRLMVWRVEGQMALLTETLIRNRESQCHPLKWRGDRFSVAKISLYFLELRFKKINVTQVSKFL